MALSPLQLLQIDGPGTPKKAAPTPDTPGLTGADLVQAKAAAAADAADKRLDTGDAQHVTRPSRGAEVTQSLNATTDLLNIMRERADALLSPAAMTARHRSQHAGLADLDARLAAQNAEHDRLGPPYASVPHNLADHLATDSAEANAMGPGSVMARVIAALKQSHRK